MKFKESYMIGQKMYVQIFAGVCILKSQTKESVEYSWAQQVI